MIIILDASAAVEVVLARPFQLEFRKRIEEAEWVIAPFLFISEVTNVFWKYVQASQMPEDRCEIAISASVSIPDQFIRDDELFREAFAMACRCRKPAYDMFYLALSRRNNGLFLTLDKTLAATAEEFSIKTFVPGKV